MSGQSTCNVYNGRLASNIEILTIDCTTVVIQPNIGVYGQLANDAKYLQAAYKPIKMSINGQLANKAKYLHLAVLQ